MATGKQSNLDIAEKSKISLSIIDESIELLSKNRLIKKLYD